MWTNNTTIPEQLRGLWPGVVLCATVALAAGFVSEHYGGPVMLYALLMGTTFHYLSIGGACVDGIDLVSRHVLRVGVALLGARITVTQIGSLGWEMLGLVVSVLIATIIFGLMMSRLLGLRRDFGILTGGAVAICGASAAMALSAVLPDHPDREKHMLMTVIGVTALSTIAMVIYPIVAHLANLDLQATGIFLGATVHDVAQVVGAGYSVSTETGDVATVVKLTRVALLVPVALAVALFFHQKGAGKGGRVEIPLFLIAFVVIMLINSTGLIPEVVTVASGDVSRACLVAAIAALGMKTSFEKIASVGWKPIALMIGETFFLAGLVLMCLAFVDI